MSTNPTNPPACRVMYRSTLGRIYHVNEERNDTPVLVIPLDPASMDAVVEVMSNAMRADDDKNTSFDDDARSALNALVALGKGTT